LASPLYVNVRHDIVADNARSGRRNSVFEIRQSIDDANPERCNYRSFRGRIRIRSPWEEGQSSLEVIEDSKALTWWLTDDPLYQFTGTSHLVYRPEAAPASPVWIEIEFGGKRFAWMECGDLAAPARSPSTARS
jgi:hypothetical protein